MEKKHKNKGGNSDPVMVSYCPPVGGIFVLIILSLLKND